MSELDINILTHGIARLLDYNTPHHKLDKYIRELREVCFGPEEDKLSKYFGRELSSEECVDCLLSLDTVVDKCLSDVDLGLELAIGVSSLSTLSNTVIVFLSTVLPTFIRQLSIENIKPLLQQLWKHLDECNYPLVLLECLVLDREKLEDIVIRGYLRLTRSHGNTGSQDNLWDTGSLNIWVKPSAKSTFIFQTMTTILNNLLISSNNGLACLNMIQSYIESVSKFSLDGLVSVYPVHYQSIISILSTNSHLSDHQMELLITRVIKPSDPHISLMFLSHFPKSLSLFNHFITPVDLEVVS